MRGRLTAGASGARSRSPVDAEENRASRQPRGRHPTSGFGVTTLRKVSTPWSLGRSQPPRGLCVEGAGGVGGGEERGSLLLRVKLLPVDLGG